MLSLSRSVIVARGVCNRLGGCGGGCGCSTRCMRPSTTRSLSGSDDTYVSRDPKRRLMKRDVLSMAPSGAVSRLLRASCCRRSPAGCSASEPSASSTSSMTQSRSASSSRPSSCAPAGVGSLGSCRGPSRLARCCAAALAIAVCLWLLVLFVFFSMTLSVLGRDAPERDAPKREAPEREAPEREAPRAARPMLGEDHVPVQREALDAVRHPRGTAHKCSQTERPQQKLKNIPVRRN